MQLSIANCLFTHLKKCFMKKIICFIFICFIWIHSYAQKRRVSGNLYINSNLCRVPTQNLVFNDGQRMLTTISETYDIFMGFGAGVLIPVSKKFSIGGDFGFISKGYFAKRENTYSSGSLTGKGFARTDLNFFESTVFLEKQIRLKNPHYKTLFSSGLFYGINLPHIMDFGLQAKGNDFGGMLAVGIQRNHVFAKIEFKKGLMEIKNSINFSFTTQILSFKFGYKF